ncbi:MAG: CarD family transcriptional regulator, partial [Pseudomonadota bacterium]
MPSHFLDISAPQSAQSVRVGQLYGSSRSLLLAEQITQYPGLSVIVCRDMADAEQIEQEIRFFTPTDLLIYRFPDLETLPYDQFSPHQDIISERIRCLATISDASSGVLILPVSTLLQKLAPQEFIQQRSLQLKVGEQPGLSGLKQKLTIGGYQSVSQVETHGEFSARGSIIDLFPMGSQVPFRIDFFDDEIETIRSFDAETQLSVEKVDAINLLPAQEYPLDDKGIEKFRFNFRENFEVDPNKCPVYIDISNANTSPGVEYYLPLFFDTTACLFDYLPENARILVDHDASAQARQYFSQIEERYEARRYNVEWPLMPPEALFLDSAMMESRLTHFKCLYFSSFKLESPDETQFNCETQPAPKLTFQPTADQPDEALRKFLEKSAFDKFLFSTESAGRREFLTEMLRHYGIHASPVDSWQDFIQAENNRFFIIASSLQEGLTLKQQGIAVICENQLFGERAGQRRRRKYRKTRDAESTIQSLADLRAGSPVVHEDHGVGRYQGLKTLTVANIETEFLCIEYANEDKLYVPVSSLHLISRYAGASEESAPLHKLGGDQWQKSRKKAQEKIHDIAVELLDIQARRQAMQGYRHNIAMEEYLQFAAEFPFEETPDQEKTIESVIQDMQASQPMDRIVCGDVGFGKTEVGMRAAFIAANSGTQVAVLVPTTLLAQQHYQNFLDRFADWPIR